MPADGHVPCGPCMLHCAYVLYKSRELDAEHQPELAAEDRDRLLSELDTHALAWAQREASELGGFAFLAREISDASLLLTVGQEGLDEARATESASDTEDAPIAAHVRATNDLPPILHELRVCGPEATCMGARLAAAAEHTLSEGKRQPRRRSAGEGTLFF